MLIYETAGFLEVESREIKQLFRSTGSICLDDTGDDAYAIQAALCDYLDNSEQRCRVAFYSKTLKRAMIFVVKGSENQSPVQYGREILALLGFELEEVNLRLSPAMLEVVLRDVPGLLAPAEGSKQRADRELLLAKARENFDKNPDSVEGRRAALKLNAEKQLNERSEELRLLLEELLVSGEAVRSDLETLENQVKDLTAQVASAEALAEAERHQREMSESITAAAEKRIQELEKVLVDVETKSSDSLKQKNKNIQLQTQIKKITGELASVEGELEKERARHEQFIAEIHAAHEQASLHEHELEDLQKALEEKLKQLAEEQTENARLDESLKASGLHIKTLENELIVAEKKASLCDEAVKAYEDVQAQLAETEQTLQDKIQLIGSLEEKLSAAVELSESLRKNRLEAEQSVDAKANERLIILTEQNKQFARELETLRDTYDQECAIHKQLARDAAGDVRRIRELESALASAIDNVSVPAVGGQDPSELTLEIANLKNELKEQSQRFQTEQRSRKELEDEVGEAHKIIDSLEKMIVENENATKERLAYDMSGTGENKAVQELLTQLKTVEGQLEQERIERKRLAEAVVVSEKTIAEQEKRLVKHQSDQVEMKIREAASAKTVVQEKVKASKPLPHELRPAPKKGSLFRPDWDLEGLPCRTSGQIPRAWEALFNVQISLEGYPSQYCMAFLVVLQLDQEEKVYMLYRLKQDKHTLVCVPTKIPKNDNALENVIQEGLRFLKLSGFEMELMSAENIDGTLTTYFLET